MKKNQNVISKCFSLGFLSKIFLVFALLFVNVDVLALDDVTPPIISNVALSQTELIAGNIVSITADFYDETPNGSTIHAYYSYVDGGGMGMGMYMYLDQATGKLRSNLGFHEQMWNGVYAFTKIVATDGAGNSIEYPLEGLTFTVSGAVDRDTTAPILTNVTLSQTVVQPGDVIYVSADIEDPSLYMNVFSYLYFSNSDGSDSKRIDLYYNNENRKLEGTINIDESITNGTWKLDSLSARDAQGNWGNLELTGMTFTVQGGDNPDVSSPEISNFTISKSEVKVGDSIVITVDINDESLSGAYGNIIYYDSEYNLNEANIFYNSISGKLEGTLQITETMQPGLYSFTDLTVRDGVGNASYMDLSSLSFTIIEVTTPEVTNFTISQTEVEVGDTIYFTADINYESLEGVFGILSYYDNYNSYNSNLYYNSESGKLEGSLQITELMNKGMYRIAGLEVRYGVGNMIYMDLSALGFIVLNGESEVDITPPVISNITLSQTDLQPGDVLTISSNIEDATLDGSFGYAFLNYVGHIYAFPIDLVYNASSGKIEGSIEIPSSMWNGTWKVQYFNVWDGVRNANYNELDGYYFNITGSVEPDFSAPVISNITFSKSNATHGETVNISADVDDASKLESWAQLVFYNENNNNLTNWVYLSYNPGSDKLEGSFFVYENMSYGKWILQKVTTSDKYSNYNEFQLESVSYTISDGTQRDTESPEISNFTLSKTEVEVGDSLYFTIDINDATLNGAYGTLSYYTPNYSQSEFNIYYNALSGKLEGILNISEGMPDGIYRLIGLNAKDGVGNSTYMDLSALSFTIKIKQPDITPPVISNITISQTELQPGDVLSISSDISDESLIGSYGSAYLNYVGKYYVIPVNVIFNSTTGKLESTFEIPTTMWNGSWRISYYIVWDGAGNYAYSEPTDLNFNISGGSVPDLNAPEISNITLSQTNVIPGDTVYITADIVDDSKQGSWAQLEFLFEENTNKYNWVQLLYNPETDRLEGSFIVPETMYNGNWILNRVFTGDGVSNYGNFDVDNISFTVSGGTEPDVTSPEISNFTLDKTVAKVGEFITISFDINDASLDGSYGNLSYYAPDNSERETSIYYNSTTGRLEGYLAITEDMPVGIYRFNGLNAWDGASNSTYMELNAFSFTNENQHIELDVTPPVVSNIKLSQTEANPGDLLVLTSDISDETPLGSSGYVYINYVGKYYALPISFIFNSKTGKLESTFEIPSTMWNGTWALTYMHIWDGAGNYTYIESVGLNLIITGGVEPDLNAPEISNITLSQTNVIPGDIIYITADIVDDSKQGSWAQLEFLFQSNTNSYNWVPLYYNSETDKLEGSFTVTDTLYNGNWKLTRVFAGDGVSNYTNFDVNNISINVSGGKDYDFVPPVLSNVTLSKSELSPGDVLLISADIEDETLDGSYANLYYRYNNSYNTQSIYLSYNSSSGKLEGTLDITNMTTNGNWNLMYINVFDGNGNVSTLHLYGQSFNVSGGTDPDLTPPVFSNLIVSQTETTPGDIINVSVDITDQSILDSRGQLSMKLRGSNYQQWIFMNYNQVSGKLEGSIYVDYSLSNGIWDFEYFYGVDGAGNYSSFVIDGINITVTESSEPDLNPPSVSEVTLSKSEYNVGDLLEISAKVSDERLDNIYGTVFIASEDGRDGRVVLLQYNSETGYLFGNIIVDEFMSSGTWNIELFQASDYYQNGIELTSLDIPFMINSSVNPETVRPDFVLSKNLVKNGDRLNITVDISEHDYLNDTYGNVEIYMPLTNEKYYVSLTYDPSIESLVASYIIPEFSTDGEWVIDKIGLYDGINYQFYYDSNNSFVVDNTPPVVEGVENGALYNTDKLISFNEGTATLNDNNFMSGDVATSEGENTLVVTDLLGHQTIVNFKIDKTAPVIEGLDSDTFVLSTPVISFTEGTALLNGQEFISGNTVSTFGIHSLVLTDEAGNTTTKNFVVTLPKVLGLVSSTLSYKSLELSWNSVEYASGYELYRININTGVYELIINTDGLEYVDVNLLNDRVYDYKVRAYILANGVKIFGEYSEVTSSRTSLLTPLNAQATSLSTSSINITWEPVLDADSYEVYSSTSEFGTYNLIGSSYSTSLINTKLSGGTTYFYKVRATSTVNGVKIYGEFTSPFSAIPVPSQVMGLSAAPTSSSTIKLTWNAVSGVKGYEVYRLNSLTNEYELIADITGTSFTDSKRIVNTIYYYKVEAYITVKKDKLYGDFSDIVSASTIRK